MSTCCKKCWSRRDMTKISKLHSTALTPEFLRIQTAERSISRLLRAMIALCLLIHTARGQERTNEFRAGAATSNITPRLGSSLNGGMSDRKATHVHDELHARCLVLDDGKTMLALAVCDMCMIPRE